ncbi:MAG: thioredoxin family protein [Alistipes sp.]|nr:thioredoxin family protein [Alistipes sp.]
MRKLFKTVVLTIALMLPFAAFAEDAKTFEGKVIDVQGGAPVEWTLNATDKGEGIYELTFTGNIADGYHGYPLSDMFSAPIFEFTEGGTCVGDMRETEPTHASVDEFGDTVHHYLGKMVFIQDVEAKAGAMIKGMINTNICTNETNQCQQSSFDFEIRVGEGDAAAATTEGQAPATTEGQAPATTEGQAPATTEGQAPAHTPLDWGSIIQAILWGFAALLTPCVFPMVPMTVSFFIKGSQSPAQGRFRATMYGFFIVALYVLPIAALILITRFTGGEGVTEDIFNWLSTHWIPNIIFFVIFMVFAASFFGAFEITLPSSLVNKSDAGADKGGLIGIFFMALTLVLVSFSCTGPIVGSVIIESMNGGLWMPIITMAAFAIAFALPFTLLAWFPSMLKNMPKSGGWLNSVKVVLGFIEVALGLKFLMTADQTYHWGLLDRETYLAIWIVVFSLLGLYLLGKLRFAHDDEMKHISVKRLFMAIAVFSFVVYMIPGMWGAPLNAISGYLPPMSTQDYRIDGDNSNLNAGVKYGDALHLPHNLKGYFDLDEALEAAKKENKPIFVDVTGHACNNCREMETRVWSDPRVKQMLANDYIICALYVDDRMELDKEDYYTNKNGVVMKTLGRKNNAIAVERFGVNAQPGYVLLSPDEKILAPVRGYDDSIKGFIKFLEDGLAAM